MAELGLGFENHHVDCWPVELPDAFRRARVRIPRELEKRMCLFL